MTYRFSTASDGNLSFRFGDPAQVVANRRRWLKKSGLGLDGCVTVAGQHQDNIAVVTSADLSRGMHDLSSAFPTDALVTREPGLGLFLLTADCLPLILFDPQNLVLALVHVSRKTASQRLPQKVVSLMKEKFATNPHQLQAIFGPAILPASYRLPSPVEEAADQRWSTFLKFADGEVSVDVPGYAAAQLLEYGLLEANLDRTPLADTADPAGRYFSHYRSVRTLEPEGRFATLALL